MVKDRWLSVKEIADNLGISKNTFYLRLTSTRMPSHRVIRANGHTVVTHEKPEHGRRNVNNKTPYRLLRYERARFVLGKQP